MKTLREIEARVRQAFPGRQGARFPEDPETQALMLERVRALAEGRDPPRPVGWLLHAAAGATVDHVEAAALALGWRGAP